MWIGSRQVDFILCRESGRETPEPETRSFVLLRSIKVIAKEYSGPDCHLSNLLV